MTGDQLVKCIYRYKHYRTNKKFIKPLFPISKVSLCQPEKTNTRKKLSLSMVFPFRLFLIFRNYISTTF